MNSKLFFELKNKVIELGYKNDIDWIANIAPCDSSEQFRDETIWVILNSGMREQVARLIYKRIRQAWHEGKNTATAFKHIGKCQAIDDVAANYEIYFSRYQSSDNPLEYLQSLPFIGNITKYHLAKNLGFDCIKPDRHLVRIAKENGFDDCFEFCNVLRAQTGEKISMIDMVLWRAANLKLI